MNRQHGARPGSDAQSPCRVRAFTLIELLIVIAIIAILALIAVPNFLEAQTRAKISRCEADMRTISTGITAYTVDWGAFPLGERATQRLFRDVLVIPTNPQLHGSFYTQLLTTPVAYLSSVPRDIFLEATGSDTNGRKYMPFRYETFGDNQWGHDAIDYGNWAPREGYLWALYTYGPSRQGANVRFDWVAYSYHNPGKTFTSGYSFWTTDPSYDPTNGTMSRGFLAQTNRGAFPPR